MAGQWSCSVSVVYSTKICPRRSQNGGFGILGGLSGKYVNSGEVGAFFELSRGADLASLVFSGFTPYRPHFARYELGAHMHVCRQLLILG